MNGSQPSSALRELRRHVLGPVFSRVTLIVLGAVVAVLTLVGPFGTDETLTPGFPALYWAAIVGATYVAGYGTDAVLRPRLAHPVAQVVNPVVVGLVVTCVVVLLNLLLIGRPPGGPGWFGNLLTIWAIAVIVSASMQVVVTALAREAGGPRVAAPDATPALLDRLPLDRRGALVSLTVEDHYVRVRTTRGEAMILMRLSDAIRDTAPEPGLRVHRSHWVATRQVTGARRDGDRAILSMAHGGDIPVSRAHIPAVRDAGLLPR